MCQGTRPGSGELSERINAMLKTQQVASETSFQIFEAFNCEVILHFFPLPCDRGECL